MVLDSGSNCTLAHSKYVQSIIVPNRNMEMLLADGSTTSVPVAVVKLSGPLGSVIRLREVGVVKALPCDILLDHDSKCIVQEELGGTAVSCGTAVSGGTAVCGAHIARPRWPNVGPPVAPPLGHRWANVILAGGPTLAQQRHVACQLGHRWATGGPTSVPPLGQ